MKPIYVLQMTVIDLHSKGGFVKQPSLLLLMSKY